MKNLYERAYEKLVQEEDIVFEPSGLGWVLWPTSNKGAYTDDFLLYIAEKLKEKNEEVFPQ